MIQHPLNAEKDNTSPDTTVRKKSLNSPVAILIFITIAALAAFSDLWTKHFVFEDILNTPGLTDRARLIVQERTTEDPEFYRSMNETRFLMKELELSERLCPKVKLTLSTNPGIVFGFDSIPSIVVNIVTAIMIACILCMFIFSPASDYWMHIALAIILGGAIGNLYDRLFSIVKLPVDGPMPITGHVRDFIDCSELGYNYIFNVADVWLVAGAAMIMLQWIYQSLTSKKAE